MKKLILLFCTFITVNSYAQEAMLHGIITDNNNSPIHLASVAVLNEGDSILVTSARSKENGRFEIAGLKDGNYILLTTFPKYGDYVEFFNVTAGKPNNSEEIRLTEAAKLLDEIVIRQPPIRIKGDTTEYDAGSFQVRQNASVEELLKELPGIQVDKNGKIMAQGKQVQKVLVDGDEFFSDDPTVATKNLRADAVSKVQVYDRRSDQAAFTGIDDGQEVKTIDFKLKEGAKQGYFGKASASALDKYYDASAMVNSFKKTRKLSAFGATGTTSQAGSVMGEGGSMGGGGRQISFGGGGMSVRSFGGGNRGGSSGQGLPETIKAGGHYSDKWNDGKNSAGGDYLLNNVKNRALSNTFSENTLLDSLYYTRNTSTNFSSRLQQNLNGNFEIAIDSFSQLKITARGNKGNSENSGDDSSESLNDKFNTVNSSKRKTATSTNSESFNTTAFYRKKFRKPGRTISINFNQNYNNSYSDGLLNNASRFFDKAGNQIREEITDQNKINTTRNQTWEGRASYTNPLGSNSYIEINYSLNHNNNYQKRLSYDKDTEGKYAKLADSLSSDFIYTYNTHSGGLNYRFNGKKFSFNAGGRLSHTGFDQQDNMEDSHRNYSYTNLFPSARLNYKFNSFSGIDLNYSGSTQQPTIDQLQPLKNNSDPLNVIVGNPNLKQSFSNNLGLNYNSFQMLKDQYVFAGVNFGTTSNQINSSYVIDTLGQRVTQYINVNGNFNFSAHANYSRSFGKNWRGSISPNSSFSQSTNFINGAKNISKDISFRPGLSVSKRDVEKYDFSVDYSPSYNMSKSSISAAASRNYWMHNISLDGRYTLPWKIDFASDISFEHREKLNAEDTKNQVILWNAYLEKRLLKNEQLTLRFSIHDLLDQNKGYSRSIQPNAIVESNYLTFQRYGLITLTYNFNTTGVGGGAASPARRSFGR